MKPEQKSYTLLSIARSKAKMHEYQVPAQHHINIPTDPARLFRLSIALLGDLSAAINRGEASEEKLAEFKDNLLFSAHFFDSYLQTKLNTDLDPYLIMLGSASYYLCDLPGSSSVLAQSLKGEWPNLECEGLESLLLWLLQGNISVYFVDTTGSYGTFIDRISHEMASFFQLGDNEAGLFKLVSDLRNIAYKNGTPRQLLFADVIAAIVRKKITNSSWQALPHYTKLPRENWAPIIKKETFIKELWPAQHLLGQSGILTGESAVIQMPTSAGKTKATELIVRSSFLAARTSLAIIIAPFRALCHEIRNSLAAAFSGEVTRVDELSDALQTDFEIAELLGHQQILIMTPEKFLYALRHTPDLAYHAGLVVFDEGHQFDSGKRGITYELLLTSLRSMLPVGVQKILVSAVISNAEAIGEWLNGDTKVVSGINLNPTLRSIGFASWMDQLGRIEYVSNEDIEKGEFYVPRVLQSVTLDRKKGERKDRIFPQKDDGHSIALYLGLTLINNGSVAIFCGTKATAASLCARIVDLIQRNVPLALPAEFSDAGEIEKLHFQHQQNLGTNAPATQSAEHGVFSHHGNTPHGIRLAVEHAMREGHAKFVICTSTLAQGVNLPIRYLIVTSVYQGLEKIKVRDFHNLIGRAGRAGMHTEGSVLFADPAVYDKRRNRRERWRWRQVEELLDPDNSEPCISNLLSIFDPIESKDSKFTLKMTALEFADAYVDDAANIDQLAKAIAERHAERNFTLESVQYQIAWKMDLISAIESFLLSHWDHENYSDAYIEELAGQTLAYFLATDEQKQDILSLFKILAKNISEKVADPDRKKIYGQSLFGITDSAAIEEWVQNNIEQLHQCDTQEELLKLIWPLLSKHIGSTSFKKIDTPDALLDLTLGWLEGQSFDALLKILNDANAKMIWGTKRRTITIDHVVDIGESALGYHGALIIGAITEFLELGEADVGELLHAKLKLFHKQLKYGLPNEASIVLYELGFSDRVLAQTLANGLNMQQGRKNDILLMLALNRDNITQLLTRYPAYYRDRMTELI